MDFGTYALGTKTVRSQKSEVGGQTRDDRRQTTEDTDHNFEIRISKFEMVNLCSMPYAINSLCAGN